MGLARRADLADDDGQPVKSGGHSPATAVGAAPQGAGFCFPDAQGMLRAGANAGSASPDPLQAGRIAAPVPDIMLGRSDEALDRFIVQLPHGLGRGTDD